MLPVTAIASNKAALCRSVLDELPEWFAIAEAKQAYGDAAEGLPMFACRIDGDPVGFVSLRPRTEAAAEIHVMGVRPLYHRHGIGRALIDASVRWALERRLRFLTVKTLAATHPDPHYALTRRFYEAVGFAPLEVFPTLWTEGNPCLLMIKPVALAE